MIRYSVKSFSGEILAYTDENVQFHESGALRNSKKIKATVQISSSFVFGIMQYEWEMFANCLAEAEVSGGRTRPLTYTWNRK